MVKRFFCLSAALFFGASLTTTAEAQTPAEYKIELETESASGTWKIGLGVDNPTQGGLVWADFNGNGRKDAGEGWSAARLDNMGVCNFSQRRTTDRLTIYGPVSTLICGENGIVTLNAGGNPELRTLAANQNSISVVDLTSNARLERINLGQNQLARVKLVGLSSLVDLRLEGNTKMSSLDLQGVDALQRVDISETNISRINNANFANLTGINLSAAPDFDLSVLATAGELQELGMEGLKVSTLDLTRHPRLRSLWAPTCEFERLDFSACPDLSQVMLSYNKLTGADFSHNLKLKNIYLENNNLAYLRLPQSGSSVRVINVAGVKTLTSLDLSNQTKLRVLQLDDSGVASLNLSANPELLEITMSATEIRQLDLRHAPGLETLNVSGCKNLTTLDLSGSNQLSVLYCGKSGLSSLDLSGCTSLREFVGDANGFTELIFNSSALKEVNISGNNIEGAAMTRLIESLPRTTGGRFVVVDQSLSGQENKCTKEHVKLAKDKGWMALDRNIGGSDYLPYEGKDGLALEAVEARSVKVFPTTASRTFTIAGASGSAYRIYSLSGQLVRRGVLVDALETVSVADLPAATYVVDLGMYGTHRVQVIR